MCADSILCVSSSLYLLLYPNRIWPLLWWGWGQSELEPMARFLSIAASEPRKEEHCELISSRPLLPHGRNQGRPGSWMWPWLQLPLIPSLHVLSPPCSLDTDLWPAAKTSQRHHNWHYGLRSQHGLPRESSSSSLAGFCWGGTPTWVR
jgi:hypothetical protein